MKQLFAILLTLTILAQSLVRVGVVVYYQLNKAYISQKICENRSNPRLHCNGHCYLSKQLKKAEEGESKQTQSIIKEKDEIIPNIRKVVVVAFTAQNADEFNPYIFTVPVSDYRNDLVKPPAA